MMKKIIQQITNNYLSKLPEDELFYRPEDLANCDFPSFLVRRIQLDLEHKLTQSISRPRTKWADTASRRVENGWQHFLYTLRALAVVPSNEMEPLLKEDVSELIHILVQPRQAIPEWLFEEKTRLSANKIQERVKWLVVYPHFGQVLSRYMERKGRDKLPRMRCEKIIETVDEKITEGYSALQWSEMLRPLFELTNSPVDSDLFRLFFEDRQMNEIARKFGELNSVLTRDVFADTLFSFLEQKQGYYAEEESSHLNKTEINPLSTDQKDSGDESSDLPEQEESIKQKPAPIEIQASDEDESGSDKQAKIKESRKEKDLELNREMAEEHPDHSTEDEENQSSGDLQPNPSERQPGTEQRSESEPDPEDQPASLNDIFTDETEQSENEQIPGKETSANAVNRFSNPQDNEAERPIWQRFVDSEENAEDSSSEKKPVNRNFREEQDKLERYLQNNEDYFVESLFEGSKQAYRKSLANISRQKNWNEAYRIIDQQIFKPNRINMYSQEAVDFTDRLQTYFLEKKK